MPRRGGRRPAFPRLCEALSQPNPTPLSEGWGDGLQCFAGAACFVSCTPTVNPDAQKAFPTTRPSPTGLSHWGAGHTRGVVAPYGDKGSSAVTAAGSHSGDYSANRWTPGVGPRAEPALLAASAARRAHSTGLPEPKMAHGIWYARHGRCLSLPLWPHSAVRTSSLPTPHPPSEPSCARPFFPQAGVPFVDVMCTMRDPSIPLTILEWEEWGNPNERDYYDYMNQYSPVDNVTAQHYPAIFVTAGLHDPRSPPSPALKRGSVLETATPFSNTAPHPPVHVLSTPHPSQCGPQLLSVSPQPPQGGPQPASAPSGRIGISTRNRSQSCLLSNPPPLSGPLGPK